MISELYRSKKFVKVWNSLEEFDKSVGIGSSVGSEKLMNPLTLFFNLIRGERILRNAKLYVFLILMAEIVMWTLINQMGMTAFAESFATNFSYLLVYIVSFFATLKLAGLLYFLGQRFEFLNDLIIEDKNINKFKMENLDTIKVFEKIVIFSLLLLFF